MNVTTCDINGLIIFEPEKFEDIRGGFLESWRESSYGEAGIDLPFVQDNISYSGKSVLRGLHFQKTRPQGQLVTILLGRVYDVCVDIRNGSASFGSWFGAELDADAPRQIYMPPGFAHGFCVLSDEAILHYKCTDTYHPEDEGGIVWNDPDIDISWPLDNPIISQRDAAFPLLKTLTDGDLPVNIS